MPDLVLPAVILPLQVCFEKVLLLLLSFVAGSSFCAGVCAAKVVAWRAVGGAVAGAAGREASDSAGGRAHGGGRAARVLSEEQRQTAPPVSDQASRRGNGHNNQMKTRLILPLFFKVEEGG
jgi:hypothetical protein